VGGTRGKSSRERLLRLQPGRSHSVAATMVTASLDDHVAFTQLAEIGCWPSLPRAAAADRTSHRSAACMAWHQGVIPHQNEEYKRSVQLQSRFWTKVGPWRVCCLTHPLCLKTRTIAPTLAASFRSEQAFSLRMAAVVSDIIGNAKPWRNGRKKLPETVVSVPGMAPTSLAATKRNSRKPAKRGNRARARPEPRALSELDALMADDAFVDSKDGSVARPSASTQPTAQPAPRQHAEHLNAYASGSAASLDLLGLPATLSALEILRQGPSLAATLRDA
jgi:hypothetical protein